jgi:hypothetical protein
VGQPSYPFEPPEVRRSVFQATGGRRKHFWLRRIWWTSIPVWSLGMLAWLPFFRRAISTKRRGDWLATVFYLTASVAVVVLTSFDGGSNSSSSDNTIGSVGGGIDIFLMGATALHTWILYGRPISAAAEMPAPAPIRDAALDGNAAALAMAAQANQRRAEARHIVETDPIMARDLRIGRPDLPRDYDDGGVIDVNHASAELLAQTLGWTLEDASAIVEARDRAGSFSSVA